MRILVPLSRKAEKSPSPPPSPSSTSSSAASPSDDDEKQSSTPNEQEDESYEEEEEEEEEEPKNEPDNTNKRKPRVWSKQDVIAVMRGLVEYQRVNGYGPVPLTATAIGDFHAAVAGSLTVDVTNLQLVDKLQRLRQRWRHAGPRPSGPHDALVRELSRAAWGGGGGEEVEEEEGERRRRRAGVVRKHCPMLMEAVEGTGNMAAGEAVGAVAAARAVALEGMLKRRKVEGMMHHLLKMELQMDTFKLIMDGIKNSSR